MMSLSKKRRYILGVMVVFAMALGACATPEPEVIEVEKIVEVEVEKIVEVEVPAEVLARGPVGTMVISLTTNPNSLDIPIAAERNASTVGWHMFDTLVFLDDDLVIQPALATDWTVSEDGRETIFNLRQDVNFHNGEHFTADAVVFSWERATADEIQWKANWLIVDSVEAIDDYRVKVTTPEPLPVLLELMFDNWAIIPPEYFAEVGEQGFAEAPVGTGPFMFVEWVKGDRIVMEANPNYWREGMPRVQTLIFRPIPESATRVAAIQTGEIDVAKRLTSEEAQSLLGVEGVKVVSFEQDRVYYIAFNNLTTGIGLPTIDARVRQAMNYAVDRQAIVDALFNGYATLVSSYVTPINFGYDPSVQPFPFDQDKARELLAEAGHPDGFEIEMRCPIGAYSQFEQVCEAVQGYLSEVGIEANLELMESGAYWELEAARELPGIFGDSWSNALSEPIDRITGALGIESNWAAWNTPEIEDMITRLKTTVDDDERRGVYSEFQKLMQEDPPFIWLYQPRVFEAISTRVQNYQPRPAENYFLGVTGTFVVVEE